MKWGYFLVHSCGHQNMVTEDELHYFLIRTIKVSMIVQRSCKQTQLETNMKINSAWMEFRVAKPPVGQTLRCGGGLLVCVHGLVTNAEVANGIPKRPFHYNFARPNAKP